MEKYYLMWISNGAFQTDKIGEYTSKSAGISAFGAKWSTLEGTAEIVSGVVQLVDGNFDVVEGCKRFINHPAA